MKPNKECVLTKPRGQQQKNRVNLTSVHVRRMRVAAVQLDIVHLPVCKGLSVYLQVAQNAGIARAGVVAVVLINAKTQTTCMHLNIIKVV